MTLAEIIAEFRSQRTDEVVPYFWSDAEIRRYLNAAVDEACERALLIEDRTTVRVVQIPLVAAKSDYVLNTSIIKVERVTYAGQKICETSVEALDNEDPQWETRTGHPTRYVMTGKTGIRLVPIPTTSTVAATPIAYMTVYRTALAPFTEDSDTCTSPEIPSLYHYRLMSWLYRCALLKTDSDRFDPENAVKQEVIFETAFGVRPDANVQRKRRDKQPPIVAYQW